MEEIEKFASPQGILVSALTEMYLGASVRSMESRLSRKWRDNCKRSTERKDLTTKVSEE